ncbi:MAG: NYN domain-containing protein [Ilumatobacteraceae bacterium]
MDGNNVVGASGGQWWRDRPAAVRRLLERLQRYAARTGEDVELVLDVPQDDLPEGTHDGVVVRYATRRGRDAADDRIRVRLAELAVADAGHDASIEVVTSDRALRDDARVLGAAVVGAGTFVARLDGLGC